MTTFCNTLRGLKIPVSAVRFRPWAPALGEFGLFLQPGFEPDPIQDAVSQSRNSPGQWSLVWEPDPPIEAQPIFDIARSPAVVSKSGYSGVRVDVPHYLLRRPFAGTKTAAWVSEASWGGQETGQGGGP